MSDMLSQDEINALLGNAGGDDMPPAPTSENSLTSEEIDIIGEVANISMGTAATTLFALLNNKVEISTPTVRMMSVDELSQNYDRPCVALKIGYKEGLVGANLLILKQTDVKIIASLMMGGDGNIDPTEELTDLDLSAISEAMNQMVGSSATSMSSMLGYKIDIHTPEAFVLNFDDDSFFGGLNFDTGDPVVCNSFKMVVGDLIDSEIMQIFPMEFASHIISKMKEGQAPPEPEPQISVPPAPQGGMPNYDMLQPSNNNQGAVMQNNVDVQQAQFQNFDMGSLVQQKENISIIKEVPLEITVELGRTIKPIKEILEFNPGTIIELNKLAGEPIDILVNGKFIAKGEVVVIDENFGVRVTSIINMEDRI
ncbi:MAG: flagellar motor switch phosphatase FliY [bacterium]